MAWHYFVYMVKAGYNETSLSVYLGRHTGSQGTKA